MCMSSDGLVEAEECEVMVMLRRLRSVILEVCVWILICELDFL